MNEWWKQLYGESEGKDNKGLFPSSAVFSTDLHSMGQFIQDGTRSPVRDRDAVRRSPSARVVPQGNDPTNVDGLNFLSRARTCAYINRKAYEGTVLAHTEGGVPNIVISRLPSFNEDTRLARSSTSSRRPAPSPATSLA